MRSLALCSRTTLTRPRPPARFPWLMTNSSISASSGLLFSIVCCNGKRISVCLIRMAAAGRHSWMDPRIRSKLERRKQPACQCQTVCGSGAFILHCTRKKLGSSVHLAYCPAVGTYVRTVRRRALTVSNPVQIQQSLFSRHRPDPSPHLDSPTRVRRSEIRSLSFSALEPTRSRVLNRAFAESVSVSFI